ncbi:MAG: hypothetical protein ABIA04_15340 [Pseudomonadota bacterium]
MKPANNKVIKLQKYSKKKSIYEALIKETINGLEALIDEFDHLAFSLAVNNKWQEWDEAQPVGTIIDYDMEMLLQTGDPKVTMIMKLRNKMVETLKALEE